MSELRILTPDNPTGNTPIPPRILTPDSPELEYQPQWAPWVRQFVAIGLVIGSLYAVTLLGPILQILIASFLIALIMYFPARLLSRRFRLSYKIAIVLLYLVVVGLMFFLASRLAPSLSDGVKSLQNAFSDTKTYFEKYTTDQGLISIAGVTIDLNFALQPISDLFKGAANGTTFAPGATLPKDINFQSIITVGTALIGGLFVSISGFFSTMLLALFISFLILIELPGYRRGLFKMVPNVHHRELGLLMHHIFGVWSGFFRGQLIVGMIIGVLTWTQLMLMGIQQPILLAIVVAVVSLIPNIGGIIALIPLALAPLLQGSTVFVGMPNLTVALLVVVVNLGISQVIWNVVAPGIIGDALNLPLPVIIVGVFFGAAIGGILGAFLIAPILGTLRVVVMYLLMKISRQDPYPGETIELGAI